jgi:hypothetical protein
MVTQTFTLKEFQNYLTVLPTKLEKYSGDINMEIARDLQKRIRLRAPSGSTGSLKDIKIDGTPKKVRLIGPAHWSFVNAGVAPDKFIPVEFFEMHQSNPGSTAGMTTNIPNPKAWVFAGYHGGKGFVDNSIKSQEPNIPKIIERGLSKAFSK